MTDGAAPSLLAVVPVRSGQLPVGADEAVAEAGGRVVLMGPGAETAATELAAPVRQIWVREEDGFDPGDWAARLAGTEPVCGAAALLLPGSPDGRDLAPRLAHAGGRHLYCGVVSRLGPTVTLTRFGDRAAEEQVVTLPAVLTLVAGTRGVEHRPPGYRPPRPRRLRLRRDVVAGRGRGCGQVQVLGVSPPDPSTMDLAEASFIVAGGAGLGDPETFARLGQVAAILGASLGATRIVTDAGWAPFERQIGTTGVAVDPRVYVAFGVSGAVQHTSGLGDPDHVISVNLDASCPMMARADLAVVSDAPAVVRELAARLSGPEGS